MHSIEHLSDVFLDGFDKSARVLFQKYLIGAPLVRKWMIAADFCLHDKGRPNDAFAFTLFPYDDHIKKIQTDAESGLPKDLKRSKSLTQEGVEWLRDTRRFHIALTVKKAREVFYNDPQSEPLKVARECIDLTLTNGRNNNASADTMKRLNLLKQASLANNFNVDLFGDMFLLVAFFSALAVALGRERQCEVIGFFPDRDNMTNWCEGVWRDFAHGNIGRYCDKHQLDMRQTTLTVGAPDRSTGKETMWYDYMIRAPDWLAGTIASWDRGTNKVHVTNPTHTKYLDVLEQVLPEADNIVFMHLEFANGGIQYSRIAVTRMPKWLLVIRRFYGAVAVLWHAAKSRLQELSARLMRR